MARLSDFDPYAISEDAKKLLLARFNELEARNAKLSERATELDAKASALIAQITQVRAQAASRRAIVQKNLDTIADIKANLTLI